MQNKEVNSSGLAELAKEISLDAAHGKILCCAREASVVQCENQRITCGCDKHMLIIHISFWNDMTQPLEELLSSFQMRSFFFSFWHTFHFMRKYSMQAARGSQATDYRKTAGIKSLSKRQAAV